MNDPPNTPNTGKSKMKQVWRMKTQPNQKTKRDRERERAPQNHLKALKGKLPLYAVRECFLFAKTVDGVKKNNY